MRSKKTAPPPATTRKRYRAATGINVPSPAGDGSELRLEAGDPADQLTPEQIAQLLRFDPPALMEVF